MYKNKVAFLSILVLSLSFFGCKKIVNKSCEGNNEGTKMLYNGEIREYIVYVPNSYSSSKPTPILINFHGFGGTAKDFMYETNMSELAERDTFILLYPQGSCINGFSHWNACPVGGDNKSETDDIGFIEALINKVSSDYNIDKTRIYAAGYSNGGMMAYGLANYKSELISGVASVSGTMLECYGAISHPMPVIHLHGTNDTTIPYSGNSDYASAQSVLDYWVGFNKTDATPTKNIYSNGDTTIEHYTYSGGTNGVAVEHYKYIGGEHVWFTDFYNGKSTGELIWNFLSRYDINGLK